MRLLHLLTLLALGYLLTAATCRPITEDNLDNMTKRVEMKKEPCFGDCPVFTLTIYEGGLATYEGERFTDRIGLFSKQLNDGAYNHIIEAFDKANYWQFQSVYRAQVPDLPTVTITYHKDGQSKSVKGKDGRPDAVIELETMLDGIANSEGWTRLRAPESNLPPGAIANEIIVQLMDEVDPRVWIVQYAKQGGAIKERISPNNNYWVITYDTNIIPPQEMLDWLRRDNYVLSAEFNKQVRGRN
jgi:hypothetical protein